MKVFSLYTLILIFYLSVIYRLTLSSVQNTEDSVEGLFLLVYSYSDTDKDYVLRIPPGIPIDPGSSYHVNLNSFFVTRCEELLRPPLAILEALAKDIGKYQELKGV